MLIDVVDRLFTKISKKILGWNIFMNYSFYLEQSGIRERADEFITKTLYWATIQYLALITLLCFAEILFKPGVFITLIFFVGINILVLVFIVQSLIRPVLIAGKRLRSLEENLVPALKTMYVELCAGFPLFNIFKDISKMDFGEVSILFGEVVNRVNFGENQLLVLRDVALRTPSDFFKRVMTQLNTGLSSGGNLREVVKEIINALSTEQVNEIHEFGGFLKQATMFYLLIIIVLPPLASTFIIILLLLTGSSIQLVQTIFIGLEITLLFLQFIFFESIKLKRPVLLRAEDG